MLTSVIEPIITGLIKDGVFGDVSYLGLEADDTTKNPQFSAELFFVNLTLAGPTGKEKLQLAVKLPVLNVEERKSRNLDTMFHNEVVMYKEILPYFGMESNFYPQMFYGFASNGFQPEKDLLILENLKYKNCRLSNSKVFLDIEHIFVAIKKIAEFHSFSFIQKHKDKESFLKMAKNLKVLNFPPEIEHQFNMTNAACIERGMMPFLKKNVSVDLLTTCIGLLKNPIKARKFLSSPEEPFAVLCHGDFCNNNILYKFDENEKPIDCVLIDFQFSIYGSPAIDIFFFLYMSTTSELREKYWDIILNLYWDTLRKHVPDHIIIPCFEDFLTHFAERAIYGYTIASFFLPRMMEIQSFNVNETKSSTLNERMARASSLGGEEAERKLIDIVLHLLDKNYIRAYIEFCNNKKIKY